MVRVVSGKRDLEQFVDLPFCLNERDPMWCPPFKRDVKAQLDRKENPFFEHGTAEYFLAERDGRVVGRIAAITNDLHNKAHADKVGFFGWFECENDPAAAGMLLDTAADWCRKRGHDVMRGPASFSTNDECGLLIDGFETPPTVMMPHNPRYYQPLLEGAGLAKTHDLLVYEHGDEHGITPIPERLDRAVDLCRRRYGIKVRPVNMADFGAELSRLKRIYNAAWEKNWGFVPLTDEEIDHLATQFKPIVVPELVPFVEDKDGNVIAIALVLPDLNEVLRHNRSGGMFPAAAKLLWAVKMKKLHRARIVLLGLLPEWRGKGIDAVLYHWIWRKCLDRGLGWGEAGWILESNGPMNAGLLKMGFTRYKTYRLYDRAL